MSQLRAVCVCTCCFDNGPVVGSVTWVLGSSGGGSAKGVLLMMRCSGLSFLVKVFLEEGCLMVGCPGPVTRT